MPYSTIRCPNCHHPIVDLRLPRVADEPGPAPKAPKAKAPTEDESPITRAVREEMEQGRMITIKDVAEILAVKDHYVYEIVRSGKLRSLKVGNRYRFKPEWVEDYVTENIKKKPEPAPPVVQPRRGRPRKY